MSWRTDPGPLVHGGETKQHARFSPESPPTPVGTWGFRALGHSPPL